MVLPAWSCCCCCSEESTVTTNGLSGSFFGIEDTLDSLTLEEGCLSLSVLPAVGVALPSSSDVSFWVISPSVLGVLSPVEMSIETTLGSSSFVSSGLSFLNSDLKVVTGEIERFPGFLGSLNLKNREFSLTMTLTPSERSNTVKPCAEQSYDVAFATVNPTMSCFYRILSSPLGMLRRVGLGQDINKLPTSDCT